MSTSSSKSPMPASRKTRLVGTKRTAATLLVAGIAMSGTGSAVVNAAVPTFDVGNLVMFPNRDFMTIEGYQNHIGELATITVTRNGTVIGSASHLVAEGDVAFEINHPGGACWGDGTGLKVTPDLQPGDKATISFDGEANAGDTTVQDAYATNVNYTPGATTFTVTGHVDASVNQQQSEQRIVNPALVDTAVTKRDIRAVPGGLERAAKGGYSSSLEFIDDTFVATYVFDDAAVAKIAATGGGTRFMTWQEEDAGANRQGLTIAEMEEVGGPGMGGCPAGPTDQAAPQPGGAFAIRSADKTQLKINWEPATAQPGAAAVEGYSVEAIGATPTATGQFDAVGARVSATAKGALLAGLKATESYTVEVRSLAGPRMSDSFTIQTAAPTAPTGDTTPPVVTASPAPNSDPSVAVVASSVTLTSEANTDIYYTTDGSSAVEGDLPTDNAKLYTGAIPITATTELHWIGIDQAGNTDVTKAFGTYSPAPSTVTAPAALAAPTGTVGQASVTLKWVSADTSVTGYGVQAYKAGVKDGALVETADKTITIKSLTANTAYTFTVQAKNAGGYGAESPQSAPLTPAAVTDVVTIGTARFKAGSDFRVTGTASVVGATVTLYGIKTDGTIGAAIPNATAGVTAAVAPATGGVWEVRLRNGNVPATNPGRIFAKSSLGGIAGPFTL